MTSSLMRHAMPASVRRQPESRSSAACWRATRYAIAFCSAVSLLPGILRLRAYDLGRAVRRAVLDQRALSVVGHDAGMVAFAGGFRAPFARYWLSGFLADFGDGIRLAVRPGAVLPFAVNAGALGVAVLLLPTLPSVFRPVPAQPAR